MSVEYVQPELFHAASTTPGEMARALNHGRRREAVVEITRNRVRMLSIDFNGSGPIQVRMHEGFLGAPPAVVAALRRYLITRHEAEWREVARFAQSLPSHRPAARTRHLHTRGRTYDLREIYRALNERFFSNNLRCRIGWARRPSSTERDRRQSIRYGWYDQAARAIHINPIIDSPLVERGFLEYVVFHEMLHAVVPSVRRGGRFHHHPPEFRKLESVFPHVKRMRVMARKLVQVL